MKYYEWLNEWLELYVRQSTKIRTYNKYRQQAFKYIIPYLGGYELNLLNATFLQSFTASLCKRGLSPNTVNCIISVLKNSLRCAVCAGIADKQYTGCIVRPKAREKQIECFNKNEQRKIEKYVFESGKRALFGIILCLYTGLRIGELLALKWCDIDFGKGTVSVCKTCSDSWFGGRYIKIIDSPKTASSQRLIPIPKQLIKPLKAIKSNSRCSYVVEGRNDYGAEVRTYQRTFNLLLKKLNIPHKGFHSLRHTFATRALECGMDIKTLSEIMGHKNPTVTLNRYAHSLLEHKAEMMNRVGKLLQ